MFFNFAKLIHVQRNSSFDFDNFLIDFIQIKFLFFILQKQLITHSTYLVFL